MSDYGDPAGGQPVGEPEGQGDPFEGMNDFTRSYIQQYVPEEHRGTAAPWFKQWDSQVSKAFQERAEQLKQYQGLDPNRARAATEFADRFRLNPRELLANMAELGHLKAEHVEGLFKAAQDAGAPSDDPSSQFKDLLSKELGPLQGVVAQIVQQNQQMQAERENQKQEQLYNSMLGEFQKQYGDRAAPEFVFQAGLYANLKPEEIQQRWEAGLPQTAAPKRAPYSASGSGQTPRPAKDYTKLSDDETDDVVAQMLQQMTKG